MKLIQIQKRLFESGLKIFTKLEFRRLLNVSPVSAQKLLERYTKKKVFIRLKGGLYALRQNLPSDYLVANKLYSPSYISFETALSYYNIIPEVVYAYTSVTTRITRRFNKFIYHKVKKKAFAGYKLIKIGDEQVLFAEKEKALADYYYYVFLGKKALNERLHKKGIDQKKLFFYVSLFEKPQFLKWIKNAFRATT